MKIPKGFKPTVVILAKVVALAFHVANGSNLGWLYEITKKDMFQY